MIRGTVTVVEEETLVPASGETGVGGAA
jgi:hypothetical protein